jgi:alpha-amylase
MLAYAYILTSEGYPCVFYKDYSTDHFCFGLKPHIDRLIFVHENIAEGDTLQRFKDFDVFAYERMGGAHLLVGLNNNPDVPRPIAVFTGFGANVELHDYAGHAGNVHTDANGRATITIPRNRGGAGYVCYSRPGLGGPFPIHTHSVTQMFEGAQDLDIKPAAPGQTVQIGRVFCDKGTPIRGVLDFDNRDFTAQTQLTLEILDPTGTRLGTRAFTKDEQGRSLEATASAAGFYVLTIQAANTPSSNPRPPYALHVTYQAPKT